MGRHYRGTRGDLDNLVNSYRVNNAVKYSSPEMHGFKVGALYSLGGVSGDLTRNQIWSLGASFHLASLSLGVGYLNVREPNVSFFGNSTAGTPSIGASNNPSPIFSGFLSAHTYQTIAAGAAYALERLTVAAAYTNIRFQGLGHDSAGPNPRGCQGVATFNNVETSVKYQFAPALLGGIAYVYLRQSKVAPSDGAVYQTVSLGIVYSLSKRTDVYGLVAAQHATGTASTGGDARANLTTLGSSTSGNQTSVRVGIRHKF